MYFDRPKYKDFAKKQLNGRWIIPIIMSLIILVITGILELPQSTRAAKFYSSVSVYGFSDYADHIREMADYKNYPNILELLFLGAISSILTVAALNVYIKMSHSPEDVPFSSFFEGFSDWGRAIIGFLWQYLWVFLWSLLFIIPGIIKIFAYSQTEYLIAEFKTLPPTKAVEISKIITKGYKWNLFVMELSFLGWDFLCALSFGIGNIFLNPYKNMAFVNAYHAMLKDALENGKITMEDLEK